MPVTINGTTGINTPDLDSTGDISANGVPFGKSGGNVSTNIAIGSQALIANTTGTNNLACGVNALDSNTTGTDNIALGNSAGQAVVTAGGNVFIGSNAGAFTTGVENTFIGSGVTGVDGGAGFFVTTGAKNTILGKFNGNQDGIDIRTANSSIVISDGDGLPRMLTANAATYLYAPANTVIVNTSNTKGGTVNLLTTANLFPRLNWGGSSILLVQFGGSEGIAGGVHGLFLIAVSERFGSYVCTVLSSSINDGLGSYTNTFSYNGSAFRVTQNWGSPGATLFSFWNIVNVTGALAG
jgi:hypothetical protein